VCSVRLHLRGELYGSLGATGKSHGGDKAVLLGLAGHEPAPVDVDTIPVLLDAIRGERSITLRGTQRIGFDESADLLVGSRR
jgi:L-serine dehydratase